MKRKTMLKCGLIFMGLLGILLAFSPQNAGAAPEKELKVGCIVALSGPAAAWGIGLKSGLEIAFDEINAAGGIKTSKAVYKPKVYGEDDQLKAELAVTRFNKLMYTDRIDPIVYILSGASIKALQPITTPKKILMLYGGQADFEPQKNPYTFRTLAYHYLHQQVSFQWFKKNLPEVKKVVIISPDYTAGHDQIRVFRQIAKKYDYDILSEDYFPMVATDFNPILTKLLPKKPDMLNVGCAAPGAAALIAKQARELGFKGPIYGSCMQDVRTIVDVAGDYGDNFYTNTLVYGAPGVPPKFNPFYDKVLQKHGGKWFDVSIMTHRTGYEIKAAVEIADGVDPDKLREAYMKIKIDSVQGPVRYGPPFGTQAYYPVAMTKIDKRKGNMIGLFEPEVMTEAEYLWQPKGSY